MGKLVLVFVDIDVTLVIGDTSIQYCAGFIKEGYLGVGDGVTGLVAL